MQTVCPNCYQQYDVPDDYLQQEVSCEKCHHDFFITKAKFCTECGAANPQQIFECWKCNKSFASPLPLHRVSRSGAHVAAPISSVIPKEKEKAILDIIRSNWLQILFPLGLLAFFVWLGITAVTSSNSHTPEEIFEPAALYAVNTMLGLSAEDMDNARVSLCDIRDVRNYTIVLDGVKWKCAEMTASLQVDGKHNLRQAWHKFRYDRPVGGSVFRIKMAYIQRGSQYEYKGIDVSVIKK